MTNRCTKQFQTGSSPGVTLMLPQEEVCNVRPEETHEIRKLESLCQISKSGCRLSATPAAACAVASVTGTFLRETAFLFLKLNNNHPSICSLLLSSKSADTFDH